MKKRFTEAQIVGFLREADAGLPVQMAELFQTTKQNVSSNIQNLFEENELEATSVVNDSLTPAADGKNTRL